MPLISKELVQAVQVGGVVSAPQLARREWLPSVTRSRWARATYTVNTRSKQQHSVSTLEWYAPNGQTLNAEVAVLLHNSCLTELLLLEAVELHGAVVRPVTGGLKGMAWPDAEALWRDRSQLDTAIEIDVGYDLATSRRKLISFCVQGYTSVIWGTTVHQRVRTWGDEITRMVAAGQLDQLQKLQVVFVDVWSDNDPYVNRPRCHKPMWRTLTFADQQLTSDLGG